MKTSRFIRIYLQDHEAIAHLALQLIARGRSNNTSGDLGSFLDELGRFATRHRTVLLDVMEKLEVRPRPDKRAALWIAEKAGRLKLNGRLVRYSDLSRVFELEGIAAIVTLNLAVWQSLRAVLGDDARLADVDFDALIDDARRLRDEVTEHRIAAAKRLPT